MLTFFFSKSSKIVIESHTCLHHRRPISRESGNLRSPCERRTLPNLDAAELVVQVSPWTYPISLLTDKQPPVNIVSASRWEDGGSECHTAERAELWADLASPSTTGLRTFISFMTVPNPCLHYHTAEDLLWCTQDMATEVLPTAQHRLPCNSKKLK